MNRRHVIGCLATLPFLGWSMKRSPADGKPCITAKEAETIFSARMEEKAKAAGMYNAPLQSSVKNSGVSGVRIYFEHGRWVSTLFVFWRVAGSCHGFTQHRQFNSEQGAIQSVIDSDMDCFVQKAVSKKRRIKT